MSLCQAVCNRVLMSVICRFFPSIPTSFDSVLAVTIDTCDLIVFSHRGFAPGSGACHSHKRLNQGEALPVLS